jgi:hypothetical protein
VSTKSALERELPGSIDFQGGAWCCPLIDRPPKKSHTLNERDVMTKLITSLAFAVAAALAAPAMAASHAGGAPMKASESAGKASAPKKTKKAKPAKAEAKTTDAKTTDTAKK